MSDTEEKMNKYREVLAKAEIQNANLQTSTSAVALNQQLQQEKEPDMIKEQLSLDEARTEIDYLLRGWSLGVDSNGRKAWLKPESEDMELLSDYGVHYFRDKLAWNVTKNRLLSNYDDEEIRNKMYDIATTINDDVFLLYQKIFKIPSVKRCLEELEKRVDERAEIKQFANKLLGKNVSKESISEELIKEMEEGLEDELHKIRNKLFNEKFKRFPALLRAIVDFIDDTYHRSLGGQERRSLRQHMQITETKGGYEVPTDSKGGVFGRWAGKK